MKTKSLKFPRTYADLETNYFERAPYLSGEWKLTKYKWGEGVQLPFSTWYFPQNEDHENWNLFGNCDKYGDHYMGGRWYGSTLKEALKELREDWPEIKRRHKLIQEKWGVK